MTSAKIIFLAVRYVLWTLPVGAIRILITLIRAVFIKRERLMLGVTSQSLKYTAIHANNASQKPQKAIEIIEKIKKHQEYFKNNKFWTEYYKCESGIGALNFGLYGNDEGNTHHLLKAYYHAKKSFDYFDKNAIAEDEFESIKFVYGQIGLEINKIKQFDASEIRKYGSYVAHTASGESRLELTV